MGSGKDKLAERCWVERYCTSMAWPLRVDSIVSDRVLCRLAARKKPLVYTMPLARISNGLPRSSHKFVGSFKTTHQHAPGARIALLGSRRQCECQLFGIKYTRHAFGHRLHRDRSFAKAKTCFGRL